MANPEHVAVVRQGAKAIEAWRSKDPGQSLDLTGADLARADLAGVHLFRANLTRADLTGAELGSTTLADCDLSECLELKIVVHKSPSSIGVDTLIKTFRGAGDRLTPELKDFFLGAGVPRKLLDALPGILAEVRYYSCFIAYGEPDRGFAEQLHADLIAKGVTCWVYSLDSTPGERTWGEIGQKRREAGKFVVLCSAAALVREGVKKEIEEQMDDDPDKIIPISLDELWKAPGFQVTRGSRDLKPFLLARNYANFEKGSDYGEELGRLLKALELRPQ